MKAKVDGTVYVMRHGKTALDKTSRSDGWLDTPLSSDGEISVIPAQQVLKLVPLKCVYAANLKRTEGTADLVASGCIAQPDVAISKAARTWNLGVLAGMPKRYGHPEVEKLIADPKKVPLGGESYDSFKKRFMPWFYRVSGSAKKPILVICSGSNLRCLGSELFDDSDCIDLDEGGLAMLLRSKKHWHKEVMLGAKTKGRVASLQDGAVSIMGSALGDRIS